MVAKATPSSFLLVFQTLPTSAFVLMAKRGRYILTNVEVDESFHFLWLLFLPQVKAVLVH